MGTVDVERYTGSCLISTAVRSKAKSKASDLYNSVRAKEDPPPTQSLAGDPRNLAGAPLVSIAASIRRGGGAKNKNPRKDAVWRPPVVLPPSVYVRAHPDGSSGYSPHSLQGAPLIRLPRLSKIPGPKAPVAVTSQNVSRASRGDTESVDGSSSCVSSDASSVTSDEGLASAGSDSSLPRLIKPRKRRKKERKLAFTHKPELETPSDVTCADDMLANEAIARLLQLNLDSSPEAEAPPPLLSFQHLPEASSQPWSTSSIASDHSWNSVWGSPESLIGSPWSNEIFPSSRSSSWWPESHPGNYMPQSGSKSPEPEKNIAGSLEVSSEIITSPYGHRDIEIRFFSSVRNNSGEEKR